jgi:ATP-dependent Clp protease adaptor protein ClpS
MVKYNSEDRWRLMTMSEHGPKNSETAEVQERRQTKQPPRFRVFLLNDDYTTMDFVVYILETIFHKSPAEAAQVMLHVHRKGIGLAGVYTREIAETKISSVHNLAEQHEFPLKCVMERE